jgi:hypothetical protein
MSCPPRAAKRAVVLPVLFFASNSISVDVCSTQGVISLQGFEDAGWLYRVDDAESAQKKRFTKGYKGPSETGKRHGECVPTKLGSGREREGAGQAGLTITKRHRKNDGGVWGSF